MTRYFTLISAVFILSACVPKQHYPEHWTNALENYICTKDQWDTLEKEAIFCKNNTTFSSNYCLGTAVTRHCKFIDKGK
jgi:hypothetical protein